MKEYWDINRTYIENTRKLETEIALKKEQIQKVLLFKKNPDNFY